LRAQNVLILLFQPGVVALVALNMSGVEQTVNFDLSHKGFSFTKTLLVTPKNSSKGDVVTLELFGVFIGQMSK
jgi:hypothetical protein